MELSYALFLGCTVPAREPSYELSVRRVFQNLGITLVDLMDSTCCAPMPIESLDFKTSLALATYNLCLAEDAGLDLMTICNGCFQVLSRANMLLKENKKLKADVNTVLAETGKEFRGTGTVKDYLQVLYHDYGLETIKKHIRHPLKDLKAAVFYGCHLLRPSNIVKFDDPDHPHLLDDLVELTGAKSVPYRHKTRCCGGLLRGIADDIANKLARDRLFDMSRAQVDCVVTVCPFCFLQLDIGQLSVIRQFKEPFNLPVLHYSELLGLAMGLKQDELGLNTHRIKTDSILEKIK